MFKRKKPGIAILEVIMVLAISGFMFVAVIGIFNTRRNSAVDDAARQVVSEIAKVRNEAQENYVPQSVVDPNKGKEFFGKYVRIRQNSDGVTYNNYIIGSILIDRSTNGLTFTTDRYYPWPQGLSVYLPSSTVQGVCSTIFVSCSRKPGSASYNRLPGGDLWVVYSAGSAEQSAIIAASNPVYSDFNSANQLDLRLALGVAVRSDGPNLYTRMQNSKKKYYIYMPFLANPTLGPGQ